MKTTIQNIKSCSHCGMKSNQYKDFETDLDNRTQNNKLICEGCYDDIDE